MAGQFGLVVFDLDGTLLNTIADLGEAVNRALSKRGLPLHSCEDYTLKVGHGVRNLVAVSLPDVLRSDESLIDECLADFKAWYTAHIDVYTRPYPGMQQLLKDLHAGGVKLAVASNKFQSGTEYLVKKFFCDVPFSAILGNREGFPQARSCDSGRVSPSIRRSAQRGHPGGRLPHRHENRRKRRHSGNSRLLGLPRPAWHPRSADS